jgi:two-component system OmpR family response regulator
MGILIVEDDLVFAEALVHTLREYGYAVSCVHSSARADEALLADEFDLVLLDIGLPGFDGFELLSRIRQRAQKTPVLIITARDALHDRVKGLDLGADDYLTKPIDMPELVARVRAVTRRYHGSAGNNIALGSLTLDTGGHRLLHHDKPIELSAREYVVVETMMIWANRVVTKDQIIKLLYEPGADVNQSALDVFMHRIRKKLSEANVILRTVRGLGYLLERSSD